MIDRLQTITSQQKPVEERSDIELENIRLRQELAAMQEQFQAVLAEQHAVTDAANFAKDSFLSMLSHELRTPLCAIIGWSRMILSGNLTAAQTRQGLEVIDRSATAQSQLIDNLINLSRPSSSKLPPRSTDPSSINNSSNTLPAPLQGLTILVVDDEVDVRTIISTILEHYGATVTSISSGAAALQELQTNPRVYDLLLSDLGMPEMNGWELIQSIRALNAAEGGHIPAAALTAYNNPKEQEMSLLAGFQVHIAKPVEPEQLVAIVANLARKPHS